MLAQNNIPEEEFGNPLHLRSYLRHPSPAMRLTVLRGLSAVSESPEKARKIQVLLPDILEALQDTNTDVVLKALLVLRNVMAHVESREASCVAPQLAEKLLPLFDHESSLVREHSISLFQALTEDLLSQRKEMKRAVHSSLLPLYFRMRDQSESVAKVQISELTSYVGKGVPTPPGCLGESLSGSMSCLRWWLSRVLALAIEPSARCPPPQPPIMRWERLAALPRGGDRGSPCQGCGAMSQPLLLHRPLGKLSSSLQSF
ncbi:uncharacterized protein LOC118159728 isoform X1 [Oxyura jamaicensis]|uniref:uncharacterized protein LOC118159728 isoform X1 n=1 Tax=Oxyura jamaicensis TaxID=8884 RepID=UPI0015A4F473|nr:uncharacterized protein LOC118159728 isoform X1 [Oxyura jamaicensis]